MDELRFVRREEFALIVATEAGAEFRLVVDDTVLAELRHLSRRERDGVKVRPREIQALIRSGKSLAQVAKSTGFEEADIERYAEPVLAERRYILDLAQAVQVRADAHDEDEQSFGSVIGARLVSLDAEATEWSSWKDNEDGWMIGLEFIARDTTHNAVWSFEHRKGVLSPLNSDAVNLSKQGEVGDRLIPRLRAVDDSERRGRFDSGAFDQSELAEGIEVGVTEEQPTLPASDTPTQGQTAHTQDARDTDATEAVDPNVEYVRRREIDQRAVKTTAEVGPDLSQTADLLDALRKRRGERERAFNDAASQPNLTAGNAEGPTPLSETNASASSADTRPQVPVQLPAPVPEPEPTKEAPKARNIWAASGVTGQPASTPAESRGDDKATPAADSEPERTPAASKTPAKDQPKKGRASIPSWDDILFGTRSDEDPAGR